MFGKVHLPSLTFYCPLLPPLVYPPCYCGPAAQKPPFPLYRRGMGVFWLRRFSAPQGRDTNPFRSAYKFGGPMRLIRLIAYRYGKWAGGASGAHLATQVIISPETEKAAGRMIITSRSKSRYPRTLPTSMSLGSQLATPATVFRKTGKTLSRQSP